MIHLLVIVLLSVLFGAYLSDVFQYALEHRATRAERWARFKWELRALVVTGAVWAAYAWLTP